jgi:2Fe-2S ferredoxin
MGQAPLVQIRYRTHDGQEGAFDAKVGKSLMAAAKDAKVPGVVAECGGSMVCGTCHVFIEDGWFARLPAPTEMEAELIEYGLYPATNSRLSCQILVTETLQGLVLAIPPSQR